MRTLLDEKEKTDQARSGAEKRLLELVSQLVKVLSLDPAFKLDEVDKLLVKVALAKPHNCIRGHICRVEFGGTGRGLYFDWYFPSVHPLYSNHIYRCIIKPTCYRTGRG